MVVRHGKGVRDPDERLSRPAQAEPRGVRQLPKNLLTRLYEPAADYLGVPSASLEEIVRWTREVAAATAPP